MAERALTGFRILVVEDEAMIAMTIEAVLEDLGCVVVGPVGKLDAALTLAQGGALDAAILDVHIRGGDIFPVAEHLEAVRIPFVLASGTGGWALPEAMRGHRRLTKPFTITELETEVRALRDLAERHNQQTAPTTAN